MVSVELETSTLGVLIAGLYTVTHNVDALAIPESVYLQVAEKLEYFLEGGSWNFNDVSFEKWIANFLLIYPKVMFGEEELEHLQKHTIYWEYPNGNAVLVVSMDINLINGE